MRFTVSLSEPVTYAVSFRLRTVEGTAKAPRDYAARNFIVTSLPIGRRGRSRSGCAAIDGTSAGSGSASGSRSRKALASVTRSGSGRSATTTPRPRRRARPSARLARAGL